MKSLCAPALIAAAIMGWTGRAVSAQSNNAPQAYWPNLDTSPGARVATSTNYWNTGPDSSASPTAAGTDEAKPEIKGQLEQELHSPGCNCPEMCYEGCASNWYAAAFGLVMGRNRASATWLTTAANDPNDLRLNSQNAGANWTGGGQITVGFAWNGAGGPALAFTYWGLGEMDGFASVTDTTGNPATALSSTISFGPGTTINGVPATVYFDNAQQQAVWRKDRTENLELNLLSSTYGVGSIYLTGLVGFRYFRFTDDLIYGSASFGNSFTSNGGADAAYLQFNCRNNLYGGQVGGIITWLWTNRLTAFAVTKVGVYGNQMNNQTLLYAGNAISSPDVNFTSHKTDASVLSELDLGFTWAFRQNWRLIYGYRILGVNNLSLADNQFSARGSIDQTGSLILHGAFIGLGWTF